MRTIVSTAALLALLAGCGDGEPFFTEEPEPGTESPTDAEGDGETEGTNDEGSLAGDLPPGTNDPSSTASITRYEATDEVGGGYVQDAYYVAADDTFYVDNLAFDGANVYGRGTNVSSMGGYAVYEGVETVEDSLTGALIDQFTYRAIYGASENSVLVEGEPQPATQFAIVRTGSYVDYGFGGFIYTRNGEVTLPTTGQAQFTGDYAGVRIFDGITGLEYTRGDMVMAIDFEDFNAGNGVTGHVINRELFDINGNRVALTNDYNVDGGRIFLPDINLVVGPGTMSDDGELTNGVFTRGYNATGAPVDYETGTYYAVLSGDGPDEVVGVMVMTSEDPRYEDVTVQETGGFILYR
ncbi:hypothetical protein [Pseudoroseicyclus tamaricis]|uniref:Uncharacterized protein n=1 Tax=Pseudoroseicyclus tamaricis TaxID=2705421 RepID=A0A6B2JTK4_9RHOB|nr:hypothetical protein [Pseudoroseicyclus tamaricis]NDV01380.1 hypothetical protein [Pseudoroseicyclus tamaricis]